MQYLLLIYNDPQKLDALDPAAQKALGQGYGAWLKAVSESGALCATGNWPAVITTVRVEAGKTLATDGPFAESREGVGGFCIIEAPSLEQAVELASRLPSAAVGAIEVRPLLPVPTR